MTRTPHPLVSAPTLLRRIATRSPLTLLDVRWVLAGASQYPEYQKGHLPGARWVEFEEALTGTPGDGGRHPLPSTAKFQEAMRAAGVTNDVPVVVYDAGNSLAAARCWWLLRYFGKHDVQVLDGGLPAWVAAGGELNSEADEKETTPPSGDFAETSGDFVATPGNLRVIDADRAAAYAVDHVLIDARTPERYRGDEEPIDPVAGHIPGAINLPALKNVDDNGCFLTTDDLAFRFSARGIDSHRRVGVYCGSGVQAMHLALALEVSGLVTDPAVYVGSWSHWITDPQRPIETGAGRKTAHPKEVSDRTCE